MVFDAVFCPSFVLFSFFLTQRVEITVLIPLFSRLIQDEYTRLTWKPTLAGAGVHGSGYSQDAPSPGRVFNYLFWEGLGHSAKLTSSSWPSECLGKRREESASLRLEGAEHLWGRKSSVIRALKWLGSRRSRRQEVQGLLWPLRSWQ